MIAGFFGVGGGIVIIPILMLGFGYAPSMAIGTSLVALLLPFSLLAVLQYYRMGKIGPENIKVGLMISIGLFFGSYLGARFATGVSETVLRRAFAIFLIVIAARIATMK